MKAILVPGLLLLAALAAPAQAHNSSCAWPWVDCLADCVLLDHVGTAPPHKCARDPPPTDPELSGPVRVERCPESNQYAVYVLGQQVVSCTH